MSQPAAAGNNLATQKSLPRPVATPRTPAHAAVAFSSVSPKHQSPPPMQSSLHNVPSHTSPVKQPIATVSSDPVSANKPPVSASITPTPISPPPVPQDPPASQVTSPSAAIEPHSVAPSPAQQSSTTEPPKLPLDATQSVNPTSPNTPPAATSGASSSVEASMYETPSPPSTASSPEYNTGYGSISRRRRAPENDGAQQNPPQVAVTGGNGMVSIEDDRLRSISPIRGETNVPYSDLPETTTAEVGWQGTSLVPLLPDDTTPLTEAADDVSLSGSEAILSQSRADLEQARIASRRELERREFLDGVTDRYTFICSICVMVSVVFVIAVSGMTTLLANRNYPQLEIFSDWPDGGIIPLKYGCLAPGGKPVSIPLRWRNVPKQATNLAVLFANPGALAEEGFDPVHWFVTDIPVDPEEDGNLPANASGNPLLMPPGAKERANLHSKEGWYWPPCPPGRNGTSRYVVHAYAIEAPPIIDNFNEASKIMSRFAGVPVARITGMYGQPAPLVVEDNTHGSESKNKPNDNHPKDEPAVVNPSHHHAHHHRTSF